MVLIAVESTVTVTHWSMMAIPVWSSHDISFGAKNSLYFPRNQGIRGALVPEKVRAQRRSLRQSFVRTVLSQLACIGQALALQPGLIRPTVPFDALEAMPPSHE
jgi:hypothetical protein